MIGNNVALPDQDQPVDDPGRRRLPPLLRRAWYSLNQAFRRRIAHVGATPDQFTVLRTVLEGDRRGMTQSEVAQTMSSDPNTVAALVERMEKLGWVERRPHEADRRAHRIQVSAMGKRKYLQARTIAIALQEEVLSVVPKELREQFLAQLASVGDACRHAAEQTARKAGRGGKRPNTD